LSLLLVIFAQFLDHDISLSATYNAGDCCANENDLEKCAPVRVAYDSFFPTGKCLSITRSVVFCEELGCATDPINSLTAYIDASQVYGSDNGNSSQERFLQNFISAENFSR
jgi:hypothetical protein